MNEVGAAAALGRAGASVAVLREHNLSSVLSALATHGTLARAEIARHSGLRVSALTAIVQELRDRGLVEEAEGEQQTFGRPVRPLSLAKKPWALLGVQCDRTRILAALGNLGGEVESVHEFPVPAYTGLEGYLPHLGSALRSLLDLASTRSRTVLAVEIGVPGAVNRAQGAVVRSVLNGWDAGPLAQDVRSMLDAAGSSAVVGVDRETNYTMLSCIAVPGRSLTEKSVAFIGGRGAISGGLFSRATVEHGSGGLAGEFGHLVIDPGGHRCWCGRQGCSETRLGLASIYSRVTGADYAPSLASLYGHYDSMTAELRSLLDQGDPCAVKEFAEAGRWLGITIDAVSGVVNPEIFVVSGFLAAFRDAMEPEMRHYLGGLEGLPALAGLQVDFGSADPGQMLQGMVLAGRARVVAAPSLAAPAP